MVYHLYYNIIMGSLFSSSYVGCIDRIMYGQIFQPPNQTRFELTEMTDKGILTFSIDKDISIVGCLAKPKKMLQVSQKYIIYSHGNAEDIFDTCNYMQYLADKFGVNCVSYDYPGYGKSVGTMTEENCYKSLEYVVDFIVNAGASKDDIILIGRSLGTGIVVNYAHKYAWTRPIILISPYKTIISVVTDSSIKALIDKFQSIKKIEHVVCPVKIIHGEMDNIINVVHGKELHKLLKKECIMQPSWIRYANHNNILEKIDDKDFIDVIYYKK